MFVRALCCVVVLATAHALGLYWFVDGFFPERIVVPPAAASASNQSAAAFEFPPLFRSRDDDGGLGGDGAAPAPRFGKLVVMVVDALRASFLYGNDTHFHYTRHLIDTRQALAYVAVAQAPTVTLPRIKVSNRSVVVGVGVVFVVVVVADFARAHTRT